MRIFFFILALVVGLCGFFPSGAAAAEKETRIKSASKLTYFRNSGPVFFSEAAYNGLLALKRGHADKAYAVWVEQGLAGDLEALAMAAMLCRMEEKKTSAGWRVQIGSNPPPPAPVCPVPAQFWENSLISLLGEGEATLLLGLFGMELMEVDPHRKARDYAPPVEAYMLRSAHAGNAEGMYGAYLTGEERTARFTPPKNMPDVPVLPEKYEPESSYEQRYWLTQAAYAGCRFAMEGLAWRYEGKDQKHAPHDLPKAEQYYDMAAMNGSSLAAGVLQVLYAKGFLFPQDCPKSIYYGALDIRLLKGGQIVLDDPSFREGKILGDYKEGFIKGELWFADKRVVHKPCLTQAEFDDAVARSLPAYEKAKAVLDEERERHDALYGVARERLPEIRAAYEQAIRDNQRR